MDIYKYNCYRRFLEDFLTTNEISLRSIEEKSGKVLKASEISLALKKDRNGNYLKARDLKAERVVIALKGLGLNKKELECLMVLIYENNALELNVKFGKVPMLILQSLRKKVRQSTDKTNDSINELDEIFKRVPDSTKSKISKLIEKEVKIAISRNPKLDKFSLVNYISYIKNK